VVEAGRLLDVNEELDLAMIKRRSRDDDLLRPALVDVGTSLRRNSRPIGLRTAGRETLVEPGLRR
jgi:hypothetical protein